MTKGLHRLDAHGVKLISVIVLLCCVAIAGEARGQQEPAVPVVSHTPDIAEVHRAALAHHELDDGVHAERLKRRIRRANLLPEIELKSTWRMQDDRESDYREDWAVDDLGFAVQDGTRQDLTTGHTRQDTYNVSLRFNLSGIVFDRRELDVDRQSEVLKQRRQRLLELVNALYYERTHYLARLLALDLDEEERLLHHHKISRCEADLDALTGGWFTPQLEGQSDEK